MPPDNAASSSCSEPTSFGLAMAVGAIQSANRLRAPGGEWRTVCDDIYVHLLAPVLLSYRTAISTPAEHSSVCEPVSQTQCLQQMRKCQSRCTRSVSKQIRHCCVASGVHHQKVCVWGGGGVRGSTTGRPLGRHVLITAAVSLTLHSLHADTRQRVAGAPNWANLS